MRKHAGFSLVELLVSMTVALFVLVAVLGAYSQANTLKAHVQGNARIQNNVRLGMDRLERDLRMIGFGVPQGTEIGGTALWTPAIFHADSTELGFRAELDGGSAEIICTPKTTNADCPRTKLLLDRIDYYDELNCAPPDGAGGNLKLVAVNGDGGWEAISCSGVNTTDDSITVTTVANNTYTAGASHARTIEQVYLRYVAQSQPPYGYLARYVRYDNTPSATFPPSPASWTVVASQLTDFWLEYQDAGGTALIGSPLTATQQAAVRKIVVFIEGYDMVGPDGTPQLIQSRSEILLRNPS